MVLLHDKTHSLASPLIMVSMMVIRRILFVSLHHQREFVSASQLNTFNLLGFHWLLNHELFSLFSDRFLARVQGTTACADYIQNGNRR
jgi:hypothetical protein